MITIEKVKSEYQAEETNWHLFGCTAEWQQKVNTAFRRIGEAIMKENGVEAEKASQLHPETPLGTLAITAYLEFRELLKSE